MNFPEISNIINVFRKMEFFQWRFCKIFLSNSDFGSTPPPSLGKWKHSHHHENRKSRGVGVDSENVPAYVFKMPFGGQTPSPLGHSKCWPILFVNLLDIVGVFLKRGNIFRKSRAFASPPPPSWTFDCESAQKSACLLFVGCWWEGFCRRYGGSLYT